MDEDINDDSLLENYCRSNLLNQHDLTLKPRVKPPTRKTRAQVCVYVYVLIIIAATSFVSRFVVFVFGVVQLRSEFVKLTESPKFNNGGSLRSYQIDSLNWMLFNWLHCRNSILADEMGEFSDFVLVNIYIQSINNFSYC
jgi:hypothetical protein